MLSEIDRHGHTVDYIFCTSAPGAPATAAWHLSGELRGPARGQAPDLINVKAVDGVQERAGSNPDDVIDRPVVTGEVFACGAMRVSVLAQQPGQHVGFVIGKKVFVGSVSGFNAAGEFEWYARPSLLTPADDVGIHASDSRGMVLKGEQVTLLLVTEYRRGLGVVVEEFKREKEARQLRKEREREGKRERNWLLWGKIQGWFRALVPRRQGH